MQKSEICWTRWKAVCRSSSSSSRIDGLTSVHGRWVKVQKEDDGGGGGGEKMKEQMDKVIMF